MTEALVDESFGDTLRRETASDKMTILYYGAGWPTNIGNAFIDLGAIALLRKAAPNAVIRFASEMPRWFFRRASTSGWKNRLQGRNVSADNALDIASVTKCDLLVFAGMAMCDEFVEINGPSVIAAAKNGTAVLLMGTGGLAYSDKEKHNFGKFLNALKPLAFISRDDPSFEMFADYVPVSHKGIDCGFFLSDAYAPLPLNLPPYMVLNFDSLPEPVIDPQGRRVIRTHHECWGPVAPEYAATRDTLISDIPFDYLSLYAQADEVHSDRVHTCVATLTYGNRARLYSPTPRGGLFDAAGVGKVREQLTQVDKPLLEKKKAAQVEITRGIISSLSQNLGKIASL